MELILLKNVENVGRKGNVVRVKEGYARNFLLPQNLALTATKQNKKFVEEMQAKAEKRHEAELKEADAARGKIEALKLTVAKKVGENDKIFGSVTAEDICEALASQKYPVDKKQVQIKEPIRSLGAHQVEVEIYPRVKAAVSIEVVSEA